MESGKFVLFFLKKLCLVSGFSFLCNLRKSLAFSTKMLSGIWIGIVQGLSMNLETADNVESSDELILYISQFFKKHFSSWIGSWERFYRVPKKFIGVLKEIALNILLQIMLNMIKTLFSNGYNFYYVSYVELSKHWLVCANKSIYCFSVCKKNMNLVTRSLEDVFWVE